MFAWLIKNTIFTPTQKDTLFWCLFVIKYGIDKYEMLDNTHFIVEKQERIHTTNDIFYAVSSTAPPAALIFFSACRREK
jgi:hypothetical protein